MDLTPEPERPACVRCGATGVALADSSKSGFKHMVCASDQGCRHRRELKRVRDAAYRAGREDAAKAIEAAPAGLTIKSLTMFAGIQLDGGEYLRRDKAADLVRGKHPRTPEARGGPEHTQDGGE